MNRKYVEAEKLEKRAEELRREAHVADLVEGRKRPLADRLIYAATNRCPCGAGLAYDPFAEDEPDNPFRGPSYWDCSAILLGTAISKDQPGSVEHTGKLPFAFYEIKSEKQSSAYGATTRPKK